MDRVGDVHIGILRILQAGRGESRRPLAIGIVDQRPRRVGSTNPVGILGEKAIKPALSVLLHAVFALR